MQGRDEVDPARDERGNDEGVGRARADVRDLDVKLLVVVVQPAARDDAGVDTIETDDVSSAKESVEDEADNTADAVLGKNV